MKNILCGSFAFITAASLALCAPVRCQAQQVRPYIAPEESETGETSAAPDAEPGAQTPGLQEAPPDIQPAKPLQQGKPDITPKAGGKSRSAAKLDPMRNPDLLYRPRQAKVQTRCGSPTKVPKKAPNGLDAIDLAKVSTAKGVPIANWPITAKLSSVSFGRGEVCTPHSRAGGWPKLDFFGDKETKVEGNMWIFAFIDGRWVGGAGHWLRPGQTCKGTNLNEVGPDIYYDAPPLRNWSPCHGELVGFAVSTPARAGQWGTAERSNVHLIRWP